MWVGADGLNGDRKRGVCQDRPEPSVRTDKRHNYGYATRLIWPSMQSETRTAGALCVH
ncbi:hypothetical protein GCM10027088_15020 [Nocardia goodfellowii]|uniref:Uncharacterized protein n=1 Tax=Nocardia goodfellowii TaxID=882446 RepID=A0ABS4QDE0_9NOCA|nr:hypothetical protein [Nocardia goodfellowii]